jgi:pyruvate/2-oxoglutarate/acetoin dehydrogenase E1 component
MSRCPLCRAFVPATAADAYGLLAAAIRDDDPVVVFAPAAVLALREELPEQPAVVPLGTSRVHREGADVTVVAVTHRTASSTSRAPSTR